MSEENEFVPLSRQNVLIAGGAGFLGSHLCEFFLENGWKVYCLDNLFTGSRKNIAECLKHKKFTFIEHDIIEPYNTNVRFNLILNFACPASPIHYQADPIFTSKTCFNGTLNLLELARRHCARFVQASTSEIYGDPEQHPQPENYWGRVNPIGIRSCYDEGKRMAESLCYSFIRSYGVDVRVIRIFNTYGPKMSRDDGRVVSNFITQALSNKPITIYGNGTQTRSFCYVSDLIKGIFCISNASAQLIEGPYNMGRDEEYFIKDLAKKIIQMTNSSSQIIYHPLPSDDPVLRKPNIEKIKEAFHWAPTVSLEKGLQTTIEYFRSNI